MSTIRHPRAGEPLDDEKSLLEAIKRDPDDDGVRRRYADLLTRGDHPRGPWAHAMLDAADARRSDAERDAAISRARSEFAAALASTDARARADLAAGCEDMSLETYRERQLRPYEITARWASRSRVATAPRYRLQYERGMLGGIEIVTGSEREAEGVASVLARAAVLRFGVPSRLLESYLRRRALRDIRELRITGPITTSALDGLLALPSLARLDLSDANLADEGETGRLLETFSHVEVRAPATGPFPHLVCEGPYIRVRGRSGAFAFPDRYSSSEIPAHPYGGPGGTAWYEIALYERDADIVVVETDIQCEYGEARTDKLYVSHDGGVRFELEEVDAPRGRLLMTIEMKD